MKKHLDLTGRRFDRWLVVGFGEKRGKREYWRCQCDCGEIKLVLQDNLTRNLTKSCGCFNIERTREMGLKNKMENNPRWKGGKKKDGKGYVMIYRPDHPISNANGYVQEHRLIAAKVLGRPMKPSECMHHVDENKENNANQNLVICNDWGYHQTLHKRMRELKRRT